MMSKPASYPQVLTALIHHINAIGKPVTIGWDEVAQWENGALAQFMEVGLLTKVNNAQSLECHGCEHRCFMSVELTDNKQRAFIVCDDMELQSHMGRITVPLSRLEQWQTSPKQFAMTIAHLLGFEAIAQDQTEKDGYALGMLKGDKGRRCVWLTVKPLAIVINHDAVPVNDLLYIEGDSLQIDRLRINELLNGPTNRDSHYTPNTDKREARKLATQSMRQDWKDAYLALQKQHPNKTAIWYAQQIAKQPIAQGKSAETIRKQIRS